MRWQAILRGDNTRSLSVRQVPSADVADRRDDLCIDPSAAAAMVSHVGWRELSIDGTQLRIGAGAEIGEGGYERARLETGSAWGRRGGRSRPVTFDDDRLGGRGSRPTPASCCARYAIVEYWRCDALGQQSEFTPLVDDGAALRWPDGGPRPTPMEEDRCHSTEA